MKKKFFIISVVLIIITGLIGYSSRTADSLELLDKYYDNLKSNKLDQNYEYLSSSSQNIWTKENYKKWESIHLEAFTLKDVKIEKANECKDRELDGIKYKNIVEYNITEFEHDNYNEKDVNSNYVIYAVNENHQWKIYRGKEDPEEKISEVNFVLASMYFRGKKGKDRDLRKTQDILNESIKSNPNYSANYNLLGYVYIELHKYDEAIDIAQQYLCKTKNNQEKSEGYNTLGQAYKDKKDYMKAKECYTQAIEANPNYSASYNLLGYMYIELQRYDEAIDIVQEYLTRAKNNQEKSDGYNTLGVAYEGKKDYIKAKEYYTQAIEANSNNESAKTSLNKIDSKHDK